MRRRFVLRMVAVTAALVAPNAVGLAASGRGAVTIMSNADFLTCGCVTGGNGSLASPYVIGPYQIGSPSSGGWAVKVADVTDSFTVTGVSIGYNDPKPFDPVIWLSDVNTPSTIVSNIDANNDGTGVRLDNSSHVTLDSLNINKGNGPGIVLNGSSYVSVANSKLKATAVGQPQPTEDGLHAVDSSHLQIGGVAACPNNSICNSFDYDSGFGVYLQNTNYVTIDHASANADDTGGFVLDGLNTFNVTLTNSTAQAGGPICISVNGTKTSSGYISDLQGGVLLINGAHDNAILNDAIGADVGYSIGTGGNGFFANPCTNQHQPFSPIETPMGPGNIFTGTCYATTDIANLPPNPCK
jgi:hypothetical protein